MTRPIFWALGVSGFAAMWGVGLADKLDHRQISPSVIAPAAPTPVRATAPATGSNPLTLLADAQGHFSADVSVDGRPLRMLVDTGASLCTFSQEDAERIGIRVSEGDFTARSQTANGTVALARIRVPMIRIGSIVVYDVEAAVVPRGRLGTSLLGMSFLRRLSDVNMAHGRLDLRG